MTSTCGMPRDRRPAGARSSARDLVDRAPAVPQQPEDFPPRRIGDGAKDGFALPRRASTGVVTSCNQGVTKYVTGGLRRVKRGRRAAATRVSARNEQGKGKRQTAEPSLHGRQWVGRTSRRSRVCAFIQPCRLRRQGKTRGCGPSPSMTASSRSRSNGAVAIGCHTGPLWRGSASRALISINVAIAGLPFRPNRPATLRRPTTRRPSGKSSPTEANHDVSLSSHAGRHLDAGGVAGPPPSARRPATSIRRRPVARCCGPSRSCS